MNILPADKLLTKAGIVEHNDTDLQLANIAMALRMGKINWFQYFELVRKVLDR